MNAFASKSLSDNRKSAIQNPKWVGIFAIALTCAFGGALVEAQQLGKTFRIGLLTVGSSTTFPTRIDGFRDRLRELGYVEGKNILVEWRDAAGKLDRLPAIMAELVRLNVDVIVSSGSITTRAAKEATKTIPIVMTQDPDPIGNGFVASLARPGGNITGLSNFNREPSGKRLELLKDVVPKLSRVAVLGTSTQPGHAQALRDTELAPVSFGVKLQYLDVLQSQDIETAFRGATKGRAEAVLGLGGVVLNSQRARVVELAAKRRLPAMYSIREYVEGGGLMSYGVSVTDLDRRDQPKDCKADRIRHSAECLGPSRSSNSVRSKA